jgi:polysaccharide pyruvyl transferase WcaK-like protein
MESQALLGKLGVATELGTDTAWTFEPLPAKYGRRALRDAGWDGEMQVLAVCPINPFWWPVKPSMAKWAAHSIGGAYEKSHYRTLYFHRSGHDVDLAYQKYLSAMASGVAQFRKQRPVFVVLVAMEMLDRDACERVAERLGGAPIFAADQLNMYELVSILRQCNRMLSSRFHAIVTSMSTGVPSAGVTMDERIRNLMRERGHEHLLMTVEEPELTDRIITALQTLNAEADEIREAMGQAVARNLRAMARMGVYLEEHVARQYPEFPVRRGVVGWEAYLPSLSPNLERLLERHSGVLAA